jgi:chromosomal replication initiator protein
MKEGEGENIQPAAPSETLNGDGVIFATAKSHSLSVEMPDLELLVNVIRALRERSRLTVTPVDKTAIHPQLKLDAIPTVSEQFLTGNFPGMTLDELQGRRRTPLQVVPRQALINYLWESGASKSDIGRFLNRDHSTVIHAISKTDKNADPAGGWRRRYVAVEPEVHEEEAPVEPPIDKAALKALIIDKVIDAVANEYVTTREQITSSSRLLVVAQARHLVAYVLSRSGLSLREIGETLGGRDHSTIINSLRRAEMMIAEDGYSKAIVESILPNSS